MVFENFFLEEDLPLDDDDYDNYNCSGIYTVYAGEFLPLDNNPIVTKLFYIGETDNLSKRLYDYLTPSRESDYEKYLEWKEYVNEKEGEVLLFAVAKITPEDREQAEAALTYHHYNKNEPYFNLLCNEQNIKSFEYLPTRIITSGYNGLLDKEFTVETSLYSQ